MRIKVNGERIEVPYRLNNRVDINKTLDGILVNSHIGIKILWDGFSFLEVSAPTLYRNNLCGLCGNFNSIPKDDLVSRKGEIMTDPVSFGHSWAVGTKRVCSRTKHHKRRRGCKLRKDHR